MYIYSMKYVSSLVCGISEFAVEKCNTYKVTIGKVSLIFANAYRLYIVDIHR